MLKLNQVNFSNAMAKNLLNPTDLAKKAKLSDSTICKILREKTFSSYKALGKIAKALEVEPSELIKDEPSERK